MARLLRRMPAISRHCSSLAKRLTADLSLEPPQPHPSTLILGRMRASANKENLLRAIRMEIDHELGRPPEKLVDDFCGFTIEERPGQPYVRLTKMHNNEFISVDAVMIDKSSSSGSKDDPGVDMPLYVDLVVDVQKGERSKGWLRFICSAWPDDLVIEKVFHDRSEETCSWTYVGPDFSEMDDQIQEALLAYLKDRGVDTSLALFLHGCLANKDVKERIQWLENIKTYVQI